MEHVTQIRSWVYECLRKPLMNHLPALQQVVSCVQSAAGRSDLIKDHSPTAIEDQVRETIWDLVFQGIVVPGIDSGQQAGLPFFKITEWGKRCLEKREYLPFDAGQYMERIRRELPGIDSVVDLYLVESLKCFRCGAFVASAVMVGAASERLVLVLQNAVYGALDSVDKKKRFDDDAQGQIKRIYDAVWKKLDPVREQMPAKLGESIAIELAGVFELIRKTRNEAGHPSGRTIERDEADALLLLFPTYAKTVYAVLEWLAVHPL